MQYKSFYFKANLKKIGFTVLKVVLVLRLTFELVLSIRKEAHILLNICKYDENLLHDAGESK